MKFADEVSVALRPEVIAARAEFGHRERDLSLFRQEFGNANVTPQVEDVSGFTLALKNRDRQSRPLMDEVIEGLAEGHVENTNSRLRRSQIEI